MLKWTLAVKQVGDKGGGGGESVTKVKFVTNFYSDNVEYEVLKRCGK